MNLSRLLLAVPLLLLAAAPTASVASCAAPTLSLDRDARLQLGAQVVVEGRGFTDGCRDSMSCGVGCDDCEYDDPPPQPLQDVTLRLVQDGRTWVLASADAGAAADNRLGHTRWEFALPEDATPGRARLVADHAEPVRVRLR